MTFRKLSALILLLSIGMTSFSQDTKPDIQKDFQLRTVAELGFVGVLAHKIQFSNNGTYFDYVKDGGQDVLFSFSRLSLELDFNKRNTLVFLYQPLRLESQVLLRENLVVDDAVFQESSNVKLLYNFPFYRVSYLRELILKNDKFKLAVGGSLQVRNATISFESADGSLYRTNRDIGLVPAIKVRGRMQFSERFYAELEADGMYAPVSYLNGSDNEVVGAILDGSLRVGFKVTKPINAFLNIRYLGGGAVGTSDDDEGPGDGYVKNWLSFLTVSAGAVYSW